ncbi:unnamed protein product [Mytilus edulis]|uniref:Uncharacterized protein n=1 Tax=Mytilus edulis TaxID=6550 RepID=A0A8S3RRW5_MYTED|nr:unnamed protein product [Mytilus edulis]
MKSDVSVTEEFSNNASASDKVGLETNDDIENQKTRSEHFSYGDRVNSTHLLCEKLQSGGKYEKNICENGSDHEIVDEADKQSDKLEDGSDFVGSINNAQDGKRELQALTLVRIFLNMEDPQRHVSYEGGLRVDPQRHVSYEGGLGEDPQRHVSYEGGLRVDPQRHVSYEGGLRVDPQRHVSYEGGLWVDPQRHVSYEGGLRVDPQRHLSYEGGLREDPQRHVSYEGGLREDPQRHVSYEGGLRKILKGMCHMRVVSV